MYESLLESSNCVQLPFSYTKGLKSACQLLPLVYYPTKVWN